jgi:hypothetical protein
MSIAVASLALGIGVTVSMFTLVNAVLLRPVPVESPEELVLLFTGTDEDPYSLLSYPDFLTTVVRPASFAGSPLSARSR